MNQPLDRPAVARIVDDLGRAELGDPRRVARAQQIAARLAAKPSASLPKALVTDAELEGAYRFFSNEQVGFDALIEAHAAGTVERACGSNVVLAIHDTTTCQFPHADPREVGYLSTGKAGFLLHLALLVDTREWRRPLGIIHAETIAREKRGKSRGRHVSGKETALWKDREFQRWLRGIHQSELRMAETGTRVVHVADRESDSYEVMAAMIEVGQSFIVRARHNRVVDDDGESAYIRDLVERSDAILQREVPLSRRLAKSAPRARTAHPPRESRMATLRFSTTTAQLRRPAARKDLAATISVNVVHVCEHAPLAGQEPVDWLLYTTESLDTIEQLEWVVDSYRCRWLIEELNKALKTGCVVQQRQLESYDAILNMLALSLPIAVELLALRSLARQEPQAPASRFLSEGALAALRHLSHRPVPKSPTVQDVLWCIAGLGGHIKNNGQPGWQVLQRGMEDFLPFAAGWCAREAADL
jgi:hypothetical protein